MGNHISFNVLHVCDFSAPYRGNFIDSIASLEKYQVGVKNYYLFPARARQTSATDWIEALNTEETVAYIQEKGLIDLIFQFLHIIKKHKINRIVRHFSDKRIDMIIKCFFDGKQVVRFFHCTPDPSGNSFKQKMKRFIWKNNKLVGVSHAIADTVAAEFPGFSVYPVLNAINFERLDYADEFCKKDGISLLMMGWNCDIKGVDLAIKAVHALRSKYNLILQVVDGTNEGKAKQLAKEILGEDVDWLYCLPATNNIATYYNASDIFLSPSRREAFGYANIEAVYCKNSIVLSKVGGQGELQIEGAYWVEPENIEDLAQKIEQAVLELNLPEKIAQKERVKAQVIEQYSLKEWSKSLFDIL